MTVPIISHSRYTYSLHLEMKPEWILKRKKKRLVALLKFIISIPILKNVRNNKIPMCSQPSFYFLTFCYNCIRPLCVGERIFLNETPQIDLKTLTLSVAFLTLSFSWLYAFSSIELASAAPIKIMSLATISLTSVIHIVIFKECKGNLLFACSAIIHFWRFTKMSVFKKLIFILTSPMSWQTFHRGLLAM